MPPTPFHVDWLNWKAPRYRPPPPMARGLPPDSQLRDPVQDRPGSSRSPARSRRRWARCRAAWSAAMLRAHATVLAQRPGWAGGNAAAAVASGTAATAAGAATAAMQAPTSNFLDFDTENHVLGAAGRPGGRDLSLGASGSDRGLGSNHGPAVGRSLRSSTDTVPRKANTRSPSRVTSDTHHAWAAS